MTTQEIKDLIKGYETFWCSPDGTALDGSKRRKLQKEITRWRFILQSRKGLEIDPSGIPAYNQEREFFVSKKVPNTFYNRMNAA